MNVLTLGVNDEIIFTGFEDLPDTGDIMVRLIKDRLILSAGKHTSAAAHVYVHLINHVTHDPNLYSLIQYFSNGKPLFFLKSPAKKIEYIQA